MGNVCMGMITKFMLKYIMRCLRLHTNPFFRITFLLSNRRVTLQYKLHNLNQIIKVFPVSLYNGSQDVSDSTQGKKKKKAFC